MSIFLHSYKIDLHNPKSAIQTPALFLTQDNLGNRIQAEVFEAGTPHTITGTVTGKVMLSNGDTVVIEGGKEENRAYIDLPQAAYAIPGMVTITMKETDGESITSLLQLIATVRRSSTGQEVDPGETMDSYETLIAEMEEVRDSIPSNYSTLSNNAVRVTEQSFSLAQQKTARANIEAEIASATRLVLSTPGYVAATASATTVEVDANGDPVNAAPTSTTSVHEVLPISPGDRFCALTPSNYSTNTRMWMILGAVNTATTPHTRPILAKYSIVSELTMYTAPIGSELIVFYTSKTRQNNGTDVYYMGAQTAARVSDLEASVTATEATAIIGEGYGPELLSGTTWADGYYVSDSGVVTASAASRMSDYIPVTGGMVAFMITEHLKENTQLITSSISVYDAGKVFLSRAGTTSHREGVASTRVILPDDAAYVIISTGIQAYLSRTNLYTMTVASGNAIRYDAEQGLTDEEKATARGNAGAVGNDELSVVEELSFLNDGYSGDLLSSVTWTNGYYINASGVQTASATSRMSDYIPVTGSMIGFMVTIHKTDSTILMTSSISAYDANKVFIARAGSTSHREGMATTRVVLPVNAAYVVISTGIPTYLSRTSFYTRKRDNWWSARKWYAIGDSITYGTYSISGGSIAREPAIAHPVICANLIGYDLTNYGVPGMGFVQVSTVAPGSDSSLLDVLNNHNYAGAELVTVMLGTNDYGHDVQLGSIADGSGVASIYGRIKLIVETMQTKCPGARLVFLTPIPRATAGSAATQYCKHTANGAGYTLDDVKTAIAESCEYYGIEYINLQDTGPLNYANRTTYLYDNLHPSIAGHQLLGRWLANKLTF